MYKKLIDSLKAILLATMKEFKVWIRDPKVFFASIVAPSVVLFAFLPIFGKGASINMVITDLDKSRTSQQLVEIIRSKDSELGGKYFRITLAGDAEGEELFSEHRLLTRLVIPEGFGENFAHRKESTFLLELDNYNSDFAKNVRLYLNEAFVMLYRDKYKDVNFNIKEVREAGRISPIDSIGMGLIGLSMILAGMFNGFNSLLSEYRTQTIQAVLLSPRRRIYVLAPKFLYSLIGVILSGLLMMFTLFLVNGFVPTWSRLGGVLVLSIFTGLVYISLGMIIGLFIRSYMSAAAVSMITGVITWFASGSLGSLKLYNEVIQGIAAFLPITYTQQALRGFLLYGESRTFWVNTGYLAIFVAVSLVLLKFSVEKKLMIE